MKKCYGLFILIIILLMTVGCQPKSSTADSLSPIKASETVAPLPTTTITATVTQSPVNTVTPIPSPAQVRHLSTVPISIENAGLLQPLKTLGNQNTYVVRGFRTLLDPTFKIYAMVENPEATEGPLTFTLRDASTGAILHTLRGDSGKGFSSAFSPDGRFIAVGNDQGVLSVWNVDTGERILNGEIEKFPNLGYSRRIYSITFSPDSNLAVTTCYDGRVFALWDLNSGRQIRVRYCFDDGACDPLVFSPDGKYLVTEERLRIDLFDGKTASYLRKFARANWVITAYAFSPAGDMLAIMDRSLTISLYQFPDGKLLASFSPDKLIFDTHHLNFAVDIGSALAFSPDGNILANGYSDGSYILWDIASKQPIFVYSNTNYKWYDELGSYSGIFNLSFSPDGTVLASQSYDNSVTLWGVP